MQSFPVNGIYPYRKTRNVTYEEDSFYCTGDCNGIAY